ncbi:sulfite exporter TauE/SafE family protein [Bacillus sp. DX1.1]|uniref:sulfite exporter TauE/SafE family protein n=1 Tax=unclassified Bacillus (in: firmicutes) TaxID=185979 RepID=UPI00257040DC|nr:MULTISPECIES: sulfite exporter TauE/SafE family protein [unclassified Bacillus (in: firmicutes)]MDM5155799.1 sulfite exporter TauE/SafE family protein [Bacillus sp. DX1.1]WJE80098.1 sulfite exporter TauE/SafE family protein [Bacillus sp. DX3.1]
MAIIVTMFMMGVLLGLVGAGGAGFIIAVLTLVFHVPIHAALATSLTAMAFTTLSGMISHYREGNVAVKIGCVVGGFGAIGSYAGSQIGAIIPAHLLHWFTAGMLFLSAIFMLIRLFFFQNQNKLSASLSDRLSPYVLGKGVVLGIVTGLLAGAFGIGSAPFIQLGLMVLLGLSIRQSVGTTMLVILPIAIGGGAGYSSEGYLDYMLLGQVLIGTMFGAYVGAKFTNFAPQIILKFAMIMTPLLAGCMLLIE